LDVRNKTAIIAVDLVQSMFGKSTLVRERTRRLRSTQGLAAAV